MMHVIRPAGREAAARKYDLLSAVMALALSAEPFRQRLILRFLSLVTTRYNWQRDELVMGQREIARLWCVDKRTVKRDMARLRASGWVEVKRQGTRGRVAILGFCWDRIVQDTRPAWANIGPDFAARLDPNPAQAEAAAGQGPDDSAHLNVVPFRRRAGTGPRGGTWASAAAALQASDEALFAAWFDGLVDAGVHQGCLQLIAPSRFQASYIQTHLLGRVQQAVQQADPSVRAVSIRAE